MNKGKGRGTPRTRPAGAKCESRTSRRAAKGRGVPLGMKTDDSHQSRTDGPQRDDGSG
jgi:hypothetical protein